VSGEIGAGLRLGSMYVLEERIGSGGMGTVWRGRNTETGQFVAIKLLADNLSQDPEIVARFIRERTALTSVRHPNLVRVHDLVAERDRVALVMDLIDGVDVAKMLAQHGPMPPVEAARLGAGVCQALAAIHAGGIIHRDLKPANILLDRSGSAFLVDFGVAAVIDGARLTGVNAVMGTPLYLAPELLTGGTAGPACDVYALGICLYELLTGKPPFVGDHYAQILNQHMYASPSPNPAIPDAMWAVLQQSLAKSPTARPDAHTLGRMLYELSVDMDAVPQSAVPAPAEAEPEPAVEPAAAVPAASSAAAPVAPPTPPNGTRQPLPANPGEPGENQDADVEGAEQAGPPTPTSVPVPVPVPEPEPAVLASVPFAEPEAAAQQPDSAYVMPSESFYAPRENENPFFPPGGSGEGPFSHMATAGYVEPTPWWKRRAVAVGAAVVVLLGAGGAIVALTGGSKNTPVAGPSGASHSAAPSPTGTPQERVDRWALIGNAQDSVGSRDGTADDVKWTVTDTTHGSAGFTGKSGSQILIGGGGTGPVIDTEHSFSIAVWVVMNGPTAASSGWETVVAQRGKVGEGVALEYDPAADRWAFDMPDSDSDTAAMNSVLSTAAPTKDWYHLVATYDADTHTMTFYVNKQRQGITAHVPDWKAQGRLSIGSGLAGGQSTNWLHGAVSDVQVWNYALRQSEVDQLG
jgi:serine/threonine protein kinase